MSRTDALPGSALAQIYALIAEHELDPDLPEEVEAEAAARPADTNEPGLLDLRALPFCTIDYPTSMDLDQALLVQRDGPDWIVSYALADASHYVRPGTALYREALRRGATYYLPGVTVRMLPRSLSEGQVSLLPQVDRRALVFRMRIDPSGACVQTRLDRAVIHSRLKTWYDAVQHFVDGSPPPTEDRAVLDSLAALTEVGQARERDASGRGVVRVQRDEVAVDLESGKLHFVALREARNDIERYNEQISLLTNSEGAAMLARAAPTDPSVQPIYRVVEPPSAQRLYELGERITALAAQHGLPWAWDGRTSLAAFLASLPDHPVARAIHRQAMLVSGRAVFQSEPGPHAAVGAEVYGRFTAPMREVVGIFLHAELVEMMQGGGPPERVDHDLALRLAVIEAAGRSRALQRDLDRAVDELVLDQLLEEDRRSGRRRRATVMGFGRDKVHLMLDDPPIDVKWYFAHISRQWGRPARVSRDQLSVGELKLGSQVELSVVGYDETLQRWEFRGQLIA
jgi:ribonuclease R